MGRPGEQLLRAPALHAGGGADGHLYDANLGLAGMGGLHAHPSPPVAGHAPGTAVRVASPRGGLGGPPTVAPTQPRLYVPAGMAPSAASGGGAAAAADGPPPSAVDPAHGGVAPGPPRLDASRAASAARPYPCPICGAAFALAYNLKTHTRTVHMKEKPHWCPVCNQAFGEKGNLARHVAARHGSGKRFSCEWCDARFHRKAHLVEHMSSAHGVERPKGKRGGRVGGGDDGGRGGGGGRGGATATWDAGGGRAAGAQPAVLFAAPADGVPAYGEGRDAGDQALGRGSTGAVDCRGDGAGDGAGGWSGGWSGGGGGDGGGGIGAGGIEAGGIGPGGIGAGGIGSGGPHRRVDGEASPQSQPSGRRRSARSRGPEARRLDGREDGGGGSDSCPMDAGAGGGDGDRCGGSTRDSSSDGSSDARRRIRVNG